MNTKLIALPCGCVADIHDGAFAIEADGDVVDAELECLVACPDDFRVAECPWCFATFSVGDLAAWRGEGPPIVRPRPLVHFGGCVAELVDNLNRGGLTLIRDCDDGSQGLVPLDYLEPAWN